MDDSGKSILMGIAIGCLVTFFIMSGNSQERIQSIEDDYQEQNVSLRSQANECVGSLESEIYGLRSTLVSVDGALSAAIEPGFGYYPPYSDLLDAFVGAKNAISNGDTSNIIHTGCDF